MVSFDDFFRQPHEVGRDRFLSRLFGLFSEEVVREWCRLPDSRYEDIGRPYLVRPGERYGHTLDFTLRDRDSGDLFVAELKCELQFEGYRYLTLVSPEQVRHHTAGAAFRKLLEVAQDPRAIGVRVGGRAREVAGAILVWGAVAAEGRISTSKEFGFHDVLAVEEMLPALHRARPATWGARIDMLRGWSGELWDILLPHVPEG